MAQIVDIAQNGQNMESLPERTSLLKIKGAEKKRLSCRHSLYL